MTVGCILHNELPPSHSLTLWETQAATGMTDHLMNALALASRAQQKILVMVVAAHTFIPRLFTPGICFLLCVMGVAKM